MSCKSIDNYSRFTYESINSFFVILSSFITSSTEVMSRRRQADLKTPSPASSINSLHPPQSRGTNCSPTMEAHPTRITPRSAANSLFSSIVSGMLNKLQGQPDSYDKKSVHVQTGVYRRSLDITGRSINLDEPLVRVHMELFARPSVEASDTRSR